MFTSVITHADVGQADNWNQVQEYYLKVQAQHKKEGLGYIISGTVALSTGLIGENQISDPLEKGVYTLFQTIGIASIGYGAYQWKVGDESRHFFNVIDSESSLTSEQKLKVYRRYLKLSSQREIEINRIKSLTHGLIALLNFYSGNKQENKSVQSSLYFVGIVNTIASISYSF